jgi:hypothetical protein
MDRIRKEEFLILKRAFLEFPAEQTWSLVGNAARQMGLIGLGDTSWGRVVDGQQGEFVREAAATRSDKTLEFFDSVQKIIVLLSIGLIVLFIARDRLRVGDQERSALFVAVVGLMANAAIFGGLSVPVDRYQMRVIWILPMLAALFCIARRRTAHDDRARDA